MREKIEDNPWLERDSSDGTVINTNKSAYENRLAEIQRVKKEKEEIQSLKSDIEEIKQMLIKVINNAPE